MIAASRQALTDLKCADVCIVGAGAAGIALAVELSRTPLKVVVLDTGELTPNRASRPIHQVLPGPEVTLGVDESRRFAFGGNTNYWYGNCRPLDDADFTRRDWIPDSGWPLASGELRSYYERAQTLCGLGGWRWYDEAVCRPHLRRATLLKSSVLDTRIVQVTPEFSFATLHGNTLADASNVTVLLGIEGVRLHARGRQVIEVEARQSDGTRAAITADRFVLSAGGVENPRILLASNDLLNGPGTGASVVGKYFQEHLYYQFETELTDHVPSFRPSKVHLYNAGFGRDLAELRDYRHQVGDATIWSQLILSQVVARDLKLPGLALWFRPSFRGTPAELTALRAALGRPADLPAAAVHVLRHPILNAACTWRKFRGHADPAGKVTLVAQFEQVPDRSNRVDLMPLADALGRQGVRLRSRFATPLRAAHAQALRIAGDELGLDGRHLAQAMEAKYMAGDFGFFWHHMGTTRMGDDPETSVVDRNCKVHGLTNLFIAGSSVFPTTGTAGPTLTIVALAIRLADHLRDE
jgi:choline dehydrogenase-like flavoprotein